MEPITAVVIKGTGPGGTTPVQDKTVAVTQAGVPNTYYRVISPILALAIRFGYLFFTSLAGSLTGGGVSGQNIIVWHDFQELLYKASILAVTIALVGLIKDIATIFTRLEATHPLASGSV